MDTFKRIEYAVCDSWCDHFKSRKREGKEGCMQQRSTESEMERAAETDVQRQAMHVGMEKETMTAEYKAGSKRE